jgi:16S rRNA G1207 methylase RsmC
MPERSRQAQKRLDYKIKQKLSKASYGQILTILISEEDSCSAEIASHALSLASSKSGRGNLGRSTEQLGKFLNIIKEHCDKFNVRQLSKTFRIVGTFREIPTGIEVFRAMQQRTSKIINDFDSRGVATVLWALAKHRDQRKFVNLDLVKQLQIKGTEIISSFNSQDVANSISSLASLGSKIDTRFRDAITKHIETIGDSFQTKELVNLFWGFEKLCSVLQFNLLRRIVDRVNVLNSQDVATTLYTTAQSPSAKVKKYSSENIELLKRALVLLQTKMLDLATSANSQDIANTLHAIARMSETSSYFQKNDSLVESLVALAIRKIQSNNSRFSAAQVAQIVSCVTIVPSHLLNSFERIVCSELRRVSSEISLQGIASVFAATSRRIFTIDADVFRSLLDRACTCLKGKHHNDDDDVLISHVQIVTLLCGAAKSNETGTLAESFEKTDRACEILICLANKFHKVHTLMDHRDLSNCIWALAKLGLGRDAKCPSTILKILKSELFLSELNSSRYLPQTLWALSRLGVLNSSKSLTKRVIRVLRNNDDVKEFSDFDASSLGTLAWIFTTGLETFSSHKKFKHVAKSLVKKARSRVSEMDFKALARLDLWSRLFFKESFVSSSSSSSSSPPSNTQQKWLYEASASQNESNLFEMVEHFVTSLDNDEDKNTFLSCRNVLVVNDESREVRRILRRSFRKSHQNKTREKSVKMKHWSRFSRTSGESSERGRNKPPKLKGNKTYDICFMRLPIGTDSFLSQLHVISSVMSTIPSGRIYIYGRNRKYLTVPHVAIYPLFENARVVKQNQTFALVEALLSVQYCNEKTSLTKHWKNVSKVKFDGEKTPIPWITYPGLFAGGCLDIMTAWLLNVLSREFFSDCKSHRVDVLDFCCGSGVIAAAVKRKLKDLSVVSLLDADKLALRAAKQNVENAEKYYHSDGWTDVPRDLRFDIVVSNPPVHRYESSDLSVLKDLIDGAPAHMKPNGLIFIVAQEMIPVGLLLESNGSYSKDSICPFVDPSNRFVVWVASVSHHH